MKFVHLGLANAFIFEYDYNDMVRTIIIGVIFHVLSFIERLGLGTLDRGTECSLLSSLVVRSRRFYPTPSRWLEKWGSIVPNSR